MSAASGRRLGRPPATSSVATRERILEVARGLFAELGWGVTTNKLVAQKAGITSGALYHYFDSKLAMYLAVYEQVQGIVDDRFAEVLEADDSFAEQIRAVLVAAHDLNIVDPSLARFLGSARVDIARHDELRQLVERAPGEGVALTARLVARAIATGEVDPSRRRELAAVLRVILVGLVDAVSSDSGQHQAAVDGILALVEGQLLGLPGDRRPAGGTRAAGGRAGGTRGAASRGGGPDGTGTRLPGRRR